jgi:hypothetical protein
MAASERAGEDHMNGMQRLGGACAIVVGISYVLAGVTYFLLPVAQRPSGRIADFLVSYAQDPTFTRLLFWELALGALFAICVVLALSDILRPAGEAWVRWMSTLAIVGFAVTAVNSFRALSLQPLIASAYVSADATAKTAIAATAQTQIDPDGWLGFGVVGAWALTAGVLMLRTSALPRALGYVGVAVGLAYWSLVAGNVLDIEVLTMIGAGLGGVILAPIWFIGIGLALRRAAGAPAMARAAAPVR